MGCTMLGVVWIGITVLLLASAASMGFAIVSWQHAKGMHVTFHGNRLLARGADGALLESDIVYDSSAFTTMQSVRQRFTNVTTTGEFTPNLNVTLIRQGLVIHLMIEEDPQSEVRTGTGGINLNLTEEGILEHWEMPAHPETQLFSYSGISNNYRINQATMKADGILNLAWTSVRTTAQPPWPGYTTTNPYVAARAFRHHFAALNWHAVPANS